MAEQQFQGDWPTNYTQIEQLISLIGGLAFAPLPKPSTWEYRRNIWTLSNSELKTLSPVRLMRLYASNQSGNKMYLQLFELLNGQTSIPNGTSTADARIIDLGPSDVIHLDRNFWDCPQTVQGNDSRAGLAFGFGFILVLSSTRNIVTRIPEASIQATVEVSGGIV